VAVARPLRAGAWGLGRSPSEIWAGASAGLTRAREDPGEKLPEHLQPLYRSLRQWRNERAKRADDLGFPLASTVPFVPAPRGRGLAWIAHKKPQITLIARISAS
jgi:hypothetical protein